PGTIAHCKEINEAVRIRFRSREEWIRMYGKVHRASVFAEEHVDAFGRYFAQRASGVYQRLKESDAVLGGRIYYANGNFETEFLPGAYTTQFNGLVKRVESGDVEARTELLELITTIHVSKIPLEDVDLSQALNEFLPLSTLITEMINTGRVSDKLKRNAESMLKETYAVNTGELFLDESLFSNGSPKRHFAVFHDYKDGLVRKIPKKDHGPAATDVQMTWQLGPQVVLEPLRKNRIDAYLVSRGETYKVA
ncbi:MAG: hypothetical protein ABIG30_00440, partial [Candidatus Aenigmatarchaeota archaeon]